MDTVMVSSAAGISFLPAGPQADPPTTQPEVRLRQSLGIDRFQRLERVRLVDVYDASN